MRRKAALLSLALLLAAALWLPLLHLFFKPDPGQFRSAAGIIAPEARALTAGKLAVWTEPELRHRELQAMRNRNPEWDFMSRTFLVLALANMTLRDPAFEADALDIIDALIEDTIEHEQRRGSDHFLLFYSHVGRWQAEPPRSLFVDGEIALMLGVRRLLAENEAYGPLLNERVERMVDQMSQSPVMCGESYPDECWMFCNSVALAAIRIADVLDGGDHSPFLEAWLATARQRLVDPSTGLLISAFAFDGRPADYGYSPEGTTIWMTAHMLQIVDGGFAADQYRRAKQELAREFLGFGYSREWPPGVAGVVDIDSGPIVPFLDASASASGFAMLAAAAFDDHELYRDLLTSLNFAGFPVRGEDGQLRYQASNAVGDAVLLYSMVTGPLWDEVARRGRS